MRKNEMWIHVVSKFSTNVNTTQLGRNRKKQHNKQRKAPRQIICQWMKMKWNSMNCGSFNLYTEKTLK